MKNIIIAVGVIVLIVVVVIFCSFSPQGQVNNEYLRIHIRANSNIAADQSVKYKVKDSVVDALVPLIVSCETKEDFEKVLSDNISFVESIADKVLKESGFNYVSKASILVEEFPTRSYDGLTLESGFYDALIIELGEGTGDNWWCVVYPPLCFLKANTTENNFAYKSKLLETIRYILGNAA